MAKTPAQLDTEIQLGLDLAKRPSSPPAPPAVEVPDWYKTHAEWAQKHDAKLAKRREQRRVKERQYATPLNLSVLGRIAHGRREFPNQYAGSGNALRRCLKAGLLEIVNKKRLRITDAGYTALVDYLVDHPGAFEQPDGAYTDEVFE